MKTETANHSGKKYRSSISKTGLALMIGLAFASVNAVASGYQFGSQTVAGQGNADANSAQADDPTAVFYNPAGISRLKKTALTIGITTAMPHSDFTDHGSTRFTGGSTGGTAASDFVPSAVAAPSFYLTTPVNDQLTFGLGVFVTYGAKLDYGNSWTGRYNLTNLKLQSLEINPSLAFKLNDQHSVGFGISTTYMKAGLGQAVDVPGAVQALAGTPAATALLRQVLSAGGSPSALGKINDGHGSMDGTHWGYGFNVGYLFQLNEDTRLGLAYRSSVKQKLSGNVVWDFSNVTNDPITNKVLAAASNHANSPTKLDITTPETISANIFSQLNPIWAVMADVTWMRSSRMDNLYIQFPGTKNGNEVIQQNWKNTYRISLGANYRFNDDWMMRGGIAFDQSPIRNAKLTDPAFPDANRMWYSLGLNYQIDKKASLDLAYSYVALNDATTDYTNTCNPLSSTCIGNGETTSGKYKTNIQFIGLAFNRKF